MPMSLTQDIIYVDGPKTQTVFDAAYRAEILAVCVATDSAISALNAAWESVSELSEVKRLHEGQCLALFAKILNDIVAAIDVFRLGHYAATHALMRGVIEGVCTAVVIRLDPNLHKDYVAGTYSVNKSVAGVRRRLKCPELHKLEKIYKWYHKYAHPSAQAVADNILGYTMSKPVGGIFVPEKAEYYHKHLSNLKDVAVAIQNLLQNAYPKLKLKCSKSK